MSEKSPFFRPSANHRVIVVQQRTPGGSRRTVLKDDKVQETKSSLVGTASNLVNAIVGSGIVGIPFAVRQSGFVAGICLILFCAIVTEKSLRLLVNTAKHVHVPTYEMLAEVCFGVAGFRFVAINMFITAYGAMVSYLMLVKDSFGTLLLASVDELAAADADSNNGNGNHRGFFIAEDTVSMRRTVLLVISLAVMLPLSCKRDMADLAHTSRLNVLIDTTLVALVVYNAPFRQAALEAAEEAAENNDHSSTSMWIHPDTIFVGLGVLSFAFVCQHSAFIIAGSLDNPTAKRWSRVTFGAMLFCASLAMICGVSGYLGFREDTQGNILESLDAKSFTANIARGMLGITMLFVYPLESFVARHVCVVLLFAGRVAHEGDDANILARRDRRVGLTTALYILAVVPAALLHSLGPVLALTGAIGGSCLAYIGPGAVYLGVHGERFLQLAAQSWGSSSKVVENDDDTENDISGGGTEGDATVEDGMAAVVTSTLKNPSLTAETTPLVAGGGMKAARNGETAVGGFNAVDNDDKDTTPTTVFVVEGFWNRATWYFSGMPIWCAIARMGHARLQQHVHDLAMKSPHPIRIGEVEYKRVLVHMSKKHGNKQLLVRNNSMSTGRATATSADVSNKTMDTGLTINQQIGKGLLEQQQKKTLEADPQEEPPSWLDFYIAICFILLGLVALVAGIYSIFQSDGS